MEPIEIIAVLTGIIAVYFTVKQNWWCWPWGLINVALYLYIFFEAKLYSDAILQGIYIVLQFYGWYQWTRKGYDKSSLPVSRLTQKAMIGLSILGVIAAMVWGTLMKRYTDAALPYWDAATTAMSLIAQYLMTKKKWENWIVWILADILYIGIYINKELYLTSALYAVFLLLAISGHFAWRNELELRDKVNV